MIKTTHIVRLNPRKHVRCCKDKQGYRFFINYLINTRELDNWLEDESHLLYTRDTVSIVYKDFYFSKESIDVMYQYSEHIK